QKSRKSRYRSAAIAEVRPGSTSAARSVAGPSSSSVSSSRAVDRLTARVHGSRTHHGTCNAPSTVLKTAASTGRRALSSAFAEETLALRAVAHPHDGTVIPDHRSLPSVTEDDGWPSLTLFGRV